MSDVIARGFVQQDSYHPQSEGGAASVRLNPRGELVTADIWQQFVFDGRVFSTSNVARETAAAMGTASATFADTDPALLLDVPLGTTAIPLEIQLNQGGTVAGAMIAVLITLDDKVRYSSGGVEVTPQNLRYDEPNTSSCSFYEGTTDIVSAAATDDVTLFSKFLIQDIDAPMGSQIFWSAREHVAPALVGPASLVIYAYAATTQPSFWWNVTWAELPTADFT